jgi:hypothetical protein
MPKVWEYTRGNWEEIDNPLDELQETDFTAEMRRAGYGKEGIHGSAQEYEPSLELYRETQSTAITHRYPFLVWVSLSGDRFDPVFLPDLPSILMFLRDFAPLVHQQSKEFRAQLLETAVRKAFHAWHEHDVEEICALCDPDGMEARRRAREERRRKYPQDGHKQAAGNTAVEMAH